MWEFASILCVASFWKESTMIVAFLGLLMNFGRILFAFFSGRIIDCFPRFGYMVAAVLIQGIFTAASYGLIVAMKTGYIFAVTGPTPPIMLLPFWFLAGPLLVVTFFAQVGSVMVHLGLTKDWLHIVLHSKKYAPLDSSSVNAAMRRINLFCKVAAPLLFSILVFSLQRNEVKQWVEYSLGFVAITGLLAMVLEICLARLILNLYSDLEPAPKNLSALAANREPTVENQSFCSRLVTPWKTYGEQSVFLLSVGYVCLFMNFTGPGAFTINFLTSVDMPVYQIGIFYATSSVIGVIGSFFVPLLVPKIGPSKTAIFSIFGFFLCIVGGLIPLTLFKFKDDYSLSPDSQGLMHIWIFLGLCILSRIPLWMVDLIESQIVAASVGEFTKMKFAGSESTLTNGMVLLSFAAWLGIAEPSQYIILAGVTAVLIFLCTVLWTIWYFKYASAEENNFGREQISSVPVDQEESESDPDEKGMDIQLSSDHSD